MAVELSEQLALARAQAWARQMKAQSERTPMEKQALRSKQRYSRGHALEARLNGR